MPFRESDMPSTVCIVTFGCQMNKLDSQILRGELARSGYGLVDDPDLADVLIYNTCSVRAHAEDKVWSHLGAWRRRARRPGIRSSTSRTCRSRPRGADPACSSVARRRM